MLNIWLRVMPYLLSILSSLALCTRSRYLLEILEVFSLCLLGKQPVAPNESSSVISPLIASSPPHRAGHGYQPRKDDLVACDL